MFSYFFRSLSNFSFFIINCALPLETFILFWQWECYKYIQRDVHTYVIKVDGWEKGEKTGTTMFEQKEEMSVNRNVTNTTFFHGKYLHVRRSDWERERKNCDEKWKFDLRKKIRKAF